MGWNLGLKKVVPETTKQLAGILGTVQFIFSYIDAMGMLSRGANFLKQFKGDNMFCLIKLSWNQGCYANSLMAWGFHEILVVFFS